jgi:hypothetical protein
MLLFAKIIMFFLSMVDEFGGMMLTGGYGGARVSDG